MNRFMLVRSVMKSNRLFSAALILIYSLAMALMVMLCFFSESVDATFQSFLSEYGLPDAYILTEGSPAEMAEELEEEPGVASVSGGMVLDVQTEIPGGKILSLRYISTGKEGGIGLWNVETGERITVGDDMVAVSAAFAGNNGINVGDVLTPEGGGRLVITDVVSSPETIAAARDSSSWYDEQDFGFIYLSDRKMEELTGYSGLVNQFRIYFTEKADGEAVLESLLETPGLNAVSRELFENSPVDRQIRAGIDGTKALVTYLPGFIVLISVLFSTLFMRQIILSSRRKIALLRTLGYSPAGVTGIFIRYTLVLTVLSSVLGGLLGVFLLRAMLGIYRSVFDLPSLKITGDTWKMIIVFAALQLIGVVSCLLCTAGINRVDPASVMSGGADSADSSLPEWISKKHLGSFAKITAAAMYRSRRRLILSALCCMACLCLNHLVIGVLISKNTGLESLFGDRLLYDAMIHCEGEEPLDEVCSLDYVKKAEKRVTFSVIYDGEVMRIETLSSDDTLTKVMDQNHRNVIPEEEGILVEEGFARRHDICAGDVISVDGVSLLVTGLTREYLYPVMYISPGQAEAFGYSENNSAAVLFSDGSSVTDFSRAASGIRGYQYFTDNASRKKCASQTLKQLDMPCVVFLAFAMIIGLVIVSNMNLISIRERSREYATLQVLGTEGKRFFRMVSEEGGAQFVFASVIGVPVSVFISAFIMKAISSVSQEYPPEKFGLVTLLACAVIVLYIISGGLITLVFIRNINILKTLGQKE